MAPAPVFVPATSWTYQRDCEEKQKHDFSNLLQEFGYAVERQDGAMMRYCSCELERMFLEWRATAGRRRRSPLLAAHGS